MFSYNLQHINVYKFDTSKQSWCHLKTSVCLSPDIFYLLQQKRVKNITVTQHLPKCATYHQIKRCCYCKKKVKKIAFFGCWGGRNVHYNNTCFSCKFAGFDSFTVFTFILWTIYIYILVLNNQNSNSNVIYDIVLILILQLVKLIQHFKMFNKIEKVWGHVNKQTCNISLKL